MKRRLPALAVALAALAALAAWWRVRALRHGVIASLTTERPWAFTAFGAEAQALLIAAAVVLALLLLRAAALIARARRRPHPPSALAADLAPLLLGALVAAAVGRSALALRAYQDPCGDPELMAPLRHEMFASHATLLELARPALVALAVLGSVVLLALARRAPRAEAAPPRGPLLASLALFAVGLAAFLATRDLAHDAAHPPPLWDVAGRSSLPPSQLGALPLTKPCPPPRSAPEIAWEDGRWYVDGAEARDEAALRERLLAKRALWQAVQPGKPFPGRVALALPSSAPAGVAGRTLAVAGAAGYTEADLLGRVAPRSWPTRTLGALPYGPRVCRVTLALPAALPPGETWGESSAGLWPR
jgi:hypothetical protein